MKEVQVMIRINKKRARNLYNKGISIYLLPCKVQLDNIWIKPHQINIRDYPGEVNSFDRRVNAFEYYNCNYNQLGYYTAYYIEEEVL